MNDSAVTAALVVDLLIAAAAYVWMGFALSTVFRKAGERGWKAWVPFLNAFTLLELGGFSGWFVLLALLPVLGTVALIVIAIVAYHRINLSFGYGAGMTVLAALLNLVWLSILAWGPARWLGGPNRGSLRTANADLGARLSGGDAVAAQHEATSAESAPAAYAPAAAFSPASAFSPAPSRTPAYSPTPADGAGESSTTDPSTEQPPLPFAPPAPAFAPRTSLRPADDADGDDDDLDDSDDARIVGTTSGERAPGPRRAPISSVPTAPISLPARAVPADGPARAAAGPARASGPAESSPWAQPVDRTDLADTSAEISAVAGAPALGMPMSARSSVSAQRTAPEVPDDGFSDETIVAPRRRPRWVLTPPLGAPIHLTADVVILGRRPAEDPRYPKAQLVPVADESRTMSKTHARLERQDDVWTITDLSSTNGVALVGADDSETELAQGASATIGERFLLGDAELRLARLETL